MVEALVVVRVVKDACRVIMYLDDQSDDGIFLLNRVSYFWHIDYFVLLKTFPKVAIILHKSIDFFKSILCFASYFSIWNDTFCADLGRHEVIRRSEGVVMVEGESVHGGTVNLGCLHPLSLVFVLAISLDLREGMVLCRFCSLRCCYNL